MKCLNAGRLGHECGSYCYPDKPAPRPAWWRAYIWHWTLGALIGGALGLMVKL